MEFKLKPTPTPTPQPTQQQKPTTPTPMPVLKPLSSNPKPVSIPATPPKTSAPAAPKASAATTPTKQSTSPATPVSKFGTPKAANAQTPPVAVPKASPWKVGTPAPSGTPKAGTTSLTATGNTPKGGKLPDSPWHPANPKQSLKPDAARTGGTTPAVAGAKTPQAQATPKLTNQQIVDAKAWYAQHKEQYTPSVLKQIQEKLGIKQTGIVDTATLQAITKWQATNLPLPIDGKQAKFLTNGLANAVVLEHMFPTGLATEKSKDNFISSYEKMVQGWGQLSDKQRISRIAELVNSSLGKIGVPKVPVGIDSKTQAAGTYYPQSRTLGINPKFLGGKVPTQEKLNQLAATIYHEMRHAEQGFMQIRLKFNDPKAVAAMAPSQTVLNAARKQPLAVGSIDGIKAAAFYDSIYGRGYDFRERTMANLKRADGVYEQAKLYDEKAKQVFSEMDKLRSSENIKPTADGENKLEKLSAEYVKFSIKSQDLWGEYNKIFEDYHSLPGEADAFRIGGTIKNALDKK